MSNPTPASQISGTIHDRLGRQLRIRREDLCWRLEDIAEESGLSVSYISNLEHGRGNPTLVALTKLVNALQADLKIIMEPDE